MLVTLDIFYIVLLRFCLETNNNKNVVAKRTNSIHNKYIAATSIFTRNMWNHKLQYMNLEWNDELSISRCLAVNQYSFFSRLLYNHFYMKET